MARLTKNPLNNDAYYMNVKTGSVDSGRDWFADYISQDEQIDWDEWEGGVLIKVVNLDDEWVEA